MIRLTRLLLASAPRPPLTIFVALAAILVPNIGHAEFPEGVGLFLTDTQQARWQLENVEKQPNDWQGNLCDPPPCFGDNCNTVIEECYGEDAPPKPARTLADVVTFLNNTMEPDFLVIKIANGATVSPQIDAATAQAFNTANFKVYGYQVLTNADGAAQADALEQAVEVWDTNSTKDLDGVFLLPGDSFYRDFDKEDDSDLARGRQRRTNYITRVTTHKQGSLANKTLIYSSEDSNASHREGEVHEHFATLCDGAMPRTFWKKATPDNKFDDQERSFRKRWGRPLVDPDALKPWHGKKNLVLLAQTDMMKTSTDGVSRSRLSQFVTWVKERKNPTLLRRGYRNTTAVAVWEFAHMNRAEILDFPTGLRAWKQVVPFAEDNETSEPDDSE